MTSYFIYRTATRVKTGNKLAPAAVDTISVLQAKNLWWRPWWFSDTYFRVKWNYEVLLFNMRLWCCDKLFWKSCHFVRVPSFAQRYHNTVSAYSGLTTWFNESVDFIKRFLQRRPSWIPPNAYFLWWSRVEGGNLTEMIITSCLPQIFPW